MTALYDQWQAERQLRQSEVVNRRDQVSTDLERWQANRLAQAVQLRQDLNDLMVDLRTNTTLRLAQITEDREAQILPRQQIRQDYVQQLQANTEELLTNYQAERKISAVEVRQQLEYDCQVMQATVSELRLGIAQELRQIQQQVAADRAGYRQDQAMVRAELLPQLIAYVEDLQVQVQATLRNLADVRQEAAIVNQEQRRSDRQVLTDTVAVMFNELADFRQQLQIQRAQLSHMVWGGAAVTPAVAKPPTRPVATRPVASAHSVAEPKPAAKPAAKAKASPAKSAPAPAAKAKPAKVPPVRAAAAARPAPVATIIAPAAPEPPSLEEVVYNYLHLSQGARLSEIETELGINRFQAVDALRSLIQKDLVVKQDRSYLVQEEAIL
ncbi:hypothetical protein IQ254_01205 [Nodosilinea sp. LEGE 07088]|uniref:hypothetical protein n=1 Tax=Nodosilinea sp. LEGE 07088 TaxID=2777968 RepID=UPI001880C494|nr:hypothetical protein [Nodosilinea sp. LEGE 07088]MBE9135835.1 hypothetical protein [Nodosilinea sp. LEGE 07088]